MVGQGLVAVGIFSGILSTSTQSLGLTLQRKSHILEEEKAPGDVQRPPHRRRRWQLGMLMFVVANLLGSSIQITTLPLPVLSTLQASGLVFNSICASLILGEPFTRWSLGGTILVLGGAVLIAIFGAISENAHTLDQLLALLGRSQFIVWMVGQAILVASIIIGVKTLKILSPRTSNTPRMRLLRGMAYGAISGVLSAHSLLVAKSAVELLVRTIVDRKNQFNRWQSWIILLGLLTLALSQLYYLHRGLKLCSTSILYPFVFCVYNIIAILDGLIYFHQTSRLSLSHALLIALGTLILLAGVFALSWRLSDDPATRPAVSQNPLTPGMGFVDDESDSDAETGIASPIEHMESANGNGVPRTPITKNNDLLTITRLRRKGMTESEEIWGELEDDTRSTSPISHRRSSAMSMPTTTNANLSSPATETTSLLPRTGTGRTYRDRTRRSTMHSERGRRRRSTASASQEALGGWWKMRWWHKADGGTDPIEESDQREEGGGRGNDGS